MNKAIKTTREYKVSYLTKEVGYPWLQVMSMTEDDMNDAISSADPTKNSFYEFIKREEVK